MAQIMGTQDFMHKHIGHSTRISLVTLYEDIHDATIMRQPSRLHYVDVSEMNEQEFMQITGAYLSCSTCHVEHEINLHEMELDR